MDRVGLAMDNFIQAMRNTVELRKYMDQLDESLYRLSRETLTLRREKNELLLLVQELSSRLDKQEVSFNAKEYMNKVKELYVTESEQKEGESLGEGTS